MDEIKPGIQAPAAPAPTAAAASAQPANKAKAKTAAAQPANPQTSFQRADVNASGDGASQTAPSLAEGDQSQSAPDAFVVNGSTSNGIEWRAIGNARKRASLYTGALMFEFDNSVLNARNYSITGQDQPQPGYNHIVAGGNMGGPLEIPHVFRATGNFFINYQLTRNRNASNQSGLMPTADERKGIIPNVGTVPISPQAQALLQYYPQPNFPQSSQYNYQVPVVATQAVDYFQARVNRNFNGFKNFLSGIFNYQNSRGDNPNIFNFVDKSGTLGMNASASLRHTFKNTMSGNLRRLVQPPERPDDTVFRRKRHRCFRRRADRRQRPGAGQLWSADPFFQ